MSDKKPRGFLSQACMQTAAGGSAGKQNYTHAVHEYLHVANFVLFKASSRSVLCIH